MAFGESVCDKEFHIDSGTGPLTWSVHGDVDTILRFFTEEFRVPAELTDDSEYAQFVRSWAKDYLNAVAANLLADGQSALATRFEFAANGGSAK
jgi:hypothetical protein